MKKRSLVASIAMLVVSAIVLTSATYAWFSTSNQSQVSKINVDVANGASNLSVKAVGNYAKNPDAAPKTLLSVSDYYTSSDDMTEARSGALALADTLNPITMSYRAADTDNGIAADAAPVFNKVAYDGTTYSSFAAASESDYLTYDFQINFENPARTNAYNINIRPILATGRANDTNPFTYAIIKLVNGSDTDYYLVKPDSETVTPVIAIDEHNFGTTESPDNQEVVKENQTSSNSIIDTNDTGTWTAGGLTGFGSGHVLAKTGGVITYQVPASTTSHTATVTVYVWAEGQDVNCVGTASADDTGISFSLDAAQVIPEP